MRSPIRLCLWTIPVVLALGVSSRAALEPLAA